MKMLSACLLLLPFISCTQVQDTKNDAVIEQKIEALLSRMTLEEKIGQMNQISSYGNIEDMSGLIKKAWNCNICFDIYSENSKMKTKA